jgi:pSer/pThr/pTyr-binding forkhead associated (FHA) protein
VLEIVCVLKLIIEDDEGRKTVVPFVRDEITIGRQEGNTIRLTERNVSRRHARLVRQNGHVLVEDLGSYNGIRINGDKIQGQVPVHEGDLIQICDYDLAVQTEAAQQHAQQNPSTSQTSPLLPVNAGQNGADADALEKTAQRANAMAGAMTVKLPDLNATSPALPIVSDSSQTLGGDEDGPEEADPDDVQSASGESDTGRRQSTAIIRMDQVEGNRPRQVVDIDPSEAPRLVVLNTEFAGREFACIRTELKIGRIEDNDIALDHRSLSRTHCKIVREDSGEWRVVDMQSANGLMVNGEPYAQSALRTGDTLELGHVKFKFVGPGESFTLSPSADGVQVKQNNGGSKAPMFATLAVVVVALVGAGYWFLVRKKPVVKVDEVTATTTPEVRPPEPKPPEELTPEEQNKLTAQKLSDAHSAIEALDWKKADEILKTCFIGESACPEATALLGQMNQEKGFKLALEKAEAALEAGDLRVAQNELSAVQSSKLLEKRYRRAEARFKQDAAREIGAKPPKPIENKPPELPKPVEPPRPVVEPSLALFEEGKRLFKEKQFPAAKTQFEKCIKVKPSNADCHKFLGTTWAKLNEPDKGAREYKEFVRLAPPDHPDLDKVRAILDAYNVQK